MQKNKTSKGNISPDKFVCTSTLGIYAPMFFAAKESGEFMVYIVAALCAFACFGQGYIWDIFRSNKKFRDYLIIHQAALWSLSLVIHPALAIGIMFLPTFALSWYAIKLSDKQR
ncbi:hypothetical protein [Vibrio sp. WXL210]|uniref:hypothetical protein n=1 Tax=Vibrio sp. WXL210 TaxID=3450709 RepID=UPI003EC87CFB